MLPRPHRFASRQELRRVLSKGRRINTDIGTLIVRTNPTSGTQPWKAAVIVGKKVAKKATERNAIRRQCYEALWSIQTAVPTTTELIFLPRFGESNPTQQTIAQALKTALPGPRSQTDPAEAN